MTSGLVVVLFIAVAVGLCLSPGSALADGATSAPRVAMAKPSRLIAVRAMLDGASPISNARVKVYTAGSKRHHRRVLASTRTRALGARLIRFRAAVPRRFDVEVTGGRVAGRRFDGRLIAAVRGYRRMQVVYINPMTTVVAVHRRKHPGVTVSAAERRVKRVFGVHRSVDLHADQATGLLFNDGETYHRAARAAGGYRGMLRRMHREVRAGKALYATRPRARRPHQWRVRPARAVARASQHGGPRVSPGILRGLPLPPPPEPSAAPSSFPPSFTGSAHPGTRPPVSWGEANRDQVRALRQWHNAHSRHFWQEARQMQADWEVESDSKAEVPETDEKVPDNESNDGMGPPAEEYDPNGWQEDNDEPDVSVGDDPDPSVVELPDAGPDVDDPAPGGGLNGGAGAAEEAEVVEELGWLGEGEFLGSELAGGLAGAIAVYAVSFVTQLAGWSDDRYYNEINEQLGVARSTLSLIRASQVRLEGKFAELDTRFEQWDSAGLSALASSVSDSVKSYWDRLDYALSAETDPKDRAEMAKQLSEDLVNDPQVLTAPGTLASILAGGDTDVAGGLFGSLARLAKPHGALPLVVTPDDLDWLQYAYTLWQIRQLQVSSLAMTRMLAPSAPFPKSFMRYTVNGLQAAYERTARAAMPALVPGTVLVVDTPARGGTTMWSTTASHGLSAGTLFAAKPGPAVLQKGAGSQAVPAPASAGLPNPWGVTGPTGTTGSAGPTELTGPTGVVTGWGVPSQAQYVSLWQTAGKNGIDDLSARTGIAKSVLTGNGADKLWAADLPPAVYAYIDQVGAVGGFGGPRSVANHWVRQSFWKPSLGRVDGTGTWQCVPARQDDDRVDPAICDNTPAWASAWSTTATTPTVRAVPSDEQYWLD